MPSFHSDVPNPHLTSAVDKKTTAVLLFNLGTPDAPTSSAVRRYLREFLLDRRVVEIPRVIWWLILNLLVLPLRCHATAKKYARIWLDQDSPLRFYTQQQALALQKLFEQRSLSLQVSYAMRYGKPSIATTLDLLQQQGVEHIILLPLYPQYSATTTASVYDAVFSHLKTLRNQPALRMVKNFYNHPAYIHALHAQIENYWQIHGQPNFAAGDKLILSFHGLPVRSIAQGDPYYHECKITAHLLRQALGLSAEQALLTFQSRFGRAQWLQPYTAETLKNLGQHHTERVDVFCPGFAADCLETLEEIAIEGREIFLLAGGKNFHTLPCLNTQAAWIEALATLTQEHLHGWHTSF